MKMVECIKKHVTPVGAQMNDLAVLDGGLGISVKCDLGGRASGGGVKKIGDRKKYPYVRDTVLPLLFERLANINYNFRTTVVEV